MNLLNIEDKLSLKMLITSLNQKGCTNIVVSDISDVRLQIARKFGATHTINPEHSSLSEICSGIGISMI